METDALLEAFRDFEKKGKKDTCPVLEQFLCHVAKTGQPMIPWSQFKPYFMFKLEKVMDDFHASAPEQRRQHNPNVDFVPFEEMKKRILKIVDGYIGIPFTIQRLCELLTDPKRNYTGTEKFLMGLEKNVMVVSCVYPTSEKNGAVSLNKVNGVMFPGTSPLYADSRNVNGPALPRSLNRPKLSACDSCSTNGLPDCSVTEQPEPTTEEMEGHLISSASSPSEGAVIPSSGKKNKQTEEDSDADQHEVKKLKLDENGETESEEKESSHLKELESFSGTTESSNDGCSQENESVTSDGKSISEDHAPSSTQTDASTRRDDSCETGDVHNLDRESTEDQRELPVSLQIDASFERENVKDSGDGEGLPRDKQVSSSSNSSDLSTEGSTEISNSTNTAIDPGDHS